MLLEGLFIPLTTPLYADGRLNLPKLAANLVRYSKTPASGLIVLGPTGEPTLLTDDETRDVLRTAAQSATAEKVLLANISRDSVHATLALAEFAAAQHYDSLLLGPPAIFPPLSPLELLTFFQTVADRAPLPILLLSTDALTIPARTTEQLATHPNVLGLLTTVGGDSQTAALLKALPAIQRETTVTSTFAAVTQRMRAAARPALLSAASLTSTAAAVAEPSAGPALRTRTKTVGFQIVAASQPTMLASLRAGASAIAPALAACAPQACYEVFAAWKDADHALADEKNERLIEPSQFIQSHTPGALKFACDRNGYFGGLPRLPHLPPTGEQRAAIEKLLTSLRT